MAASRFLKTPWCSYRLYHHATAFTRAAKNLPEVRVTELKNGVKVATQTTDSPTSTVGLWINAGSRYENKSTNGVGNFFEHVAFKGTNQRSCQDLEREVIGMGAQLHASTGREETAYYARCLSQDVPRAVDILGDVIQNAKLDQGEIEKQRRVILKELDEIDSDLGKVTHDYLHLTAYQGTPLEMSVYGPSENIERMSKEDIESYVKHNFVAARMALVSSGSMKHDDVVKVAEKHLSSVPSTTVLDAPAPRCRFSGSEVKDRNDWFPFAHVAIAVETCGLDSKDIYPLMLAKSVIGSWDRTLASCANTVNQLIYHIYKGPGCHSFDAFYHLYSDTGLWGCHFVVDKYSIDDFMFNLQEEWMRLCINITEAELVYAKNKLLNELMFGVEDSTPSCGDIGKQLLHLGRVIPVGEVLDSLEAVDVKLLRETCSKYIYDKCPAVAAVGPVEGLPDYTRVRANMYWLRY